MQALAGHGQAPRLSEGKSPTQFRSLALPMTTSSPSGSLVLALPTGPLRRTFPNDDLGLSASVTLWNNNNNSSSPFTKIRSKRTEGHTQMSSTTNSHRTAISKAVDKALST